MDKGRRLLARCVREHREARGWSQYDLEEHSGVHRNYISRLERGDTNACMDLLQRLADAFGITLAEFFSEPKKRR